MVITSFPFKGRWAEFNESINVGLLSLSTYQRESMYVPHWK